MVANIRLQQFRSYDDASFEFSPQVNIIVGPNASGKTNLLEAILVVARGGSYRVRDADLVRFGRPWARLDAYTDDGLRTVKLVNEPDLEKTYELSGRVFKRLTLEHTLPVVLFEPNHLSLLTGSPERRRDYLDELLQQTQPGYGTVVRSYRRALAQRNRLLKTGRAAKDHLFPWDVRLSELGATIARSRLQLVSSINKTIGALYCDLSRSSTDVAVSYRIAVGSQDYESVMLRELELRAQQDLTRGFTSFGPHREDFSIVFDGREASEVASRGETRTLVLGLKITELQLLEARRDKAPLLLLDDVFSELDGRRREALTTHLSSYQTFITTTDADVVTHHFAAHSAIIPITSN